MPRTGPKQSEKLTIEVQNLKAYRPGDVIEGRITVKPGKDGSAAAAMPEKIVLELFGRSKTKLGMKRGKQTVIYRGRAPLVQERVVLTERGDLGDGDGTQSFPFSVRMPTTLFPLQPGSASRRGRGPATDAFRSGADVDWKPDRYFLSTADDLSGKAPPSIMFYNGWGAASDKLQAYVEYALSATAVVAAVERPGWTATVPLVVRSPSTENPIENFESTVLAYRGTVETSNLSRAPAAGDDGPGGGGFPKKLSFGQKLGLKFQSSPKYAYRIYIQSPRVLQLDHPQNVPFRLWMMPVLDPEWTTVDRARAPPLRITAIDVELVTKVLARVAEDVPQCWKTDTFRFTEVKGRGNSSGEEGGDSGATAVTALREPAVLQPVWAAEASDPDPKKRGPHANAPPGTRLPMNHVPVPQSAFDLGERLRLRIFETYATVREQRSTVKWQSPILPSLKTYNISVTHTLALLVKYECAGKSSSFRHEQGITVLAASEAQARGREAALGKDGFKKDYGEWGDALGEVASSALDLVNNVLN